MKKFLPEETAQDYIEAQLSQKKDQQKILEAFLDFSPFPEPLLKGSGAFSRKWHENYFEKLIHEDLRDISQIQMLDRMLDMVMLLPDRIGSPLSVNALAQDIEVNFNTAKNFIKFLRLGYLLFELPPFYRQKTRFVRKEKKVYFYNWSLIQDEGARFENLVAMELKCRIDLFKEICDESYDLFFVRSKDGKETDFLITKDNNPYLLVEAKLKSTEIDRHHYHHSKILGDIPFIQLVREPNVKQVKNSHFYTVSASQFF